MTTKRKRKPTARAIRRERTVRSSSKLFEAERELLALPKADWGSAKA